MLMCDFCSSTSVRWRLMAITAVHEFPEVVQELTGLRGSISDGDWAACDVCMQYIKDRRKTRLIERSYRFFFVRHTEFQSMTTTEKEILRKELTEIQDVFWNNWTGLVEPHNGQEG